jgi:tRNA(fMet)-specific endonuclease VapC
VSGRPPSRIVLDTSAYSHFRANHVGIVDLIAAAETVIVPSIVLGELEAAFRIGKRTDENRVALADFLAESFVSVVPVSVEVARRYGQVFAALRKAGTPIPTNDVWIAASAMEVDAHLVTFDTDFERVRGLQRTVLAT